MSWWQRPALWNAVISVVAGWFIRRAKGPDAVQQDLRRMPRFVACGHPVPNTDGMLQHPRFCGLERGHEGPHL